MVTNEQRYTIFLYCMAEELTTDTGSSTIQTHGVLLPVLSQCLPVLDEICRHSLNFVPSSLHHDSDFIRFLAMRRGIFHARMPSRARFFARMC